MDNTFVYTVSLDRVRTNIDRVMNRLDLFLLILPKEFELACMSVVCDDTT